MAIHLVYDSKSPHTLCGKKFYDWRTETKHNLQYAYPHQQAEVTCKTCLKSKVIQWMTLEERIKFNANSL